MKIGDKVKMNKEEILNSTGNKIPIWYSDDIYSVYSIGHSTVELYEKIPNANNTIYKGYLITLAEIRRKKLLKLKNLNENRG
jgi:hypothetical protein